MAEAAPAKKSAFGTPLIIMSFVIVFFILFDFPKGIRDGTAWLAGFLLQPVIGFGGRYPLLTVFLASVVLVIATTAIRHFLVDWTKMARVQEAMRSYTSEMKEARKSNNTYKLKKLTDAQADVMQLQSSVQMDQMKPMALTMLLVIPIFAWLGVFLAAPVTFDADSTPASTYALVGLENNEAEYATVVGPARGSFALGDGVEMYAVRLEGSAETGSVTFDRHLRGGSVAIPLADAPALDVAQPVGTIAAGSHRFTLDRGTPEMTITDASGTRPVGRAVVLVHEGAQWRPIVVGTDGITVTTGDGDLYVVVPASDAGTLGGNGEIVVTDVAADGKESNARELAIAATALAPLTADGVEVHPIPIRAPWIHAWDIMDAYTWITGNAGWFPRWIVLYSLFGIPFGQIAQRALKLWEYRHVDLDADGVAAGKNE